LQYAKDSLLGSSEQKTAYTQDSKRYTEEEAQKKVEGDKKKEKYHEEAGERSRSERHADKIENFADKAAKGVQRFGEKVADTVEEIGRGDKVREKERDKTFEKEKIRTEPLGGHY